MVTNNAANQSNTGYQSLNTTGTFNGRTLIAGSNISISNGDGIAGNTTISSTATPFPPAPNTQIALFDDFMGVSFGGTTNNIESVLPWSDVDITGTTGFVLITSTENGHPGIMQNRAVSAGESYLCMDGAPLGTSIGDVFILGGGAITINWVFKIINLSTVTNRYNLVMGLAAASAGGTIILPSNGVYITYSDNVNSGQWRGTTSAAATPTNRDSAIAVTTGWHNAQIDINAAGTSVTFTVDGVSLGAAVTTNIPSVAISPFFGFNRTAGTIAAGTFFIDLFYLSQTLTTPR